VEYITIKDRGGEYMDKPVDVFNNIGQAKEYLRWWQNRLFLNDWIIYLDICEPHDMILDNVCGENELNVSLKTAVIRLLDSKYFIPRIMKECMEKTLVHELLHCKYNWVVLNDNVEGKYMDTCDHALLEQMAKSLIMVKYNVGLDYFIG
jgi:hypothetical protein